MKKSERELLLKSVQERRKLSSLLREWQRFAATLGDKLGCLSNMEDILSAVDALQKKKTKPKQKRHSYYAIIGRHTKNVIGVCTDDGIEDCIREDPGSTFVRIPKRLFEKYGMSDDENKENGFDAEFAKILKHNNQTQGWIDAIKGRNK